MGGEAKPHVNWKTIEAERREFVTPVNYVLDSFLEHAIRSAGVLNAQLTHVAVP